MAEYVLENNILKVTVDSKGCEIRDVLCKTDNTHRMWNANPEGWKRVAPVLFPLIGKYKDNQSIYNGKVYEMGQHGFARDMEFTLVKHNDGMLVMRLESDESTKEKYPFDFALELEYHLIDNEIKEVYRVINKDNVMMHFSIGGHPAFVTPENDASMAGCKIRFDADRIDEVLQIVSLTNTGKKKVGQFSLGMKQRLGIAMALLGEPELLILDEPTNGLDPIGIVELRELIRSFPGQGITVILSSHILSEVQLLADKVGIISGGILGYEGALNQGQNLEELFMDVVRKN